MALDACRCDMATVQREVRVVVVERGGPSWTCGMACGTVRGKSGGSMIRVGGAVELRHVATGTLRGCISKVARGMASCAVLDLVTTCKREEVVACELCAPVRAHRIMAFDAIHGETGTHVVRRCRGPVLVDVAVDAVVPNTCERQCIVRDMAIHTARVTVRTDQREPVLLV